MANGRVCYGLKSAVAALALLAPLPAYALHDGLTNDILWMIHEDAQLRPVVSQSITSNIPTQLPVIHTPSLNASTTSFSTTNLAALSPAAGQPTAGQSLEPPVPASIPEPPPSLHDARLTAPHESIKNVSENHSGATHEAIASDKALFFTAIGIFLQFLALVVFIWLLSVSQRRRSRAYIFVTEATIAAAGKDGQFLPQEGNGRPSLIRTGERVAARITFTNTGQTPAYRVSIDGHIKLLEWPIDESLLVSERRRDRAVENIGAADKRSKLYLVSKDREVISLSPTDIENLRNGKSAIWVYGAIKYRDVFQRQRFTRYRYFIGGPAGVRSVSLTAHEKGNEAA